MLPTRRSPRPVSGILTIAQLSQQNIPNRLTDQAAVREMVRKRIRADGESFCQC
jgi:hypothetical protein